MSEPTLTAWIYDSPMGAIAGEVRLKDLEQRGGLTVVDAITLTWMSGADRPELGHVRHRTGSAAAKGSVLGALAGTLLLAPAAGAAAGAGVGALVQRLRGAGIDAQVLTDIRERLRPGTSALVLLSRDADPDLVGPFLERDRARGDVSLVRADLRDDAPDVLRALLDGFEGPPAPSPQP